VSEWETGRSRPIEPSFQAYLGAIGWDKPIAHILLPSKIDEQLSHDDSSANAHWRVVSDYQPFSGLSEAELTGLDASVQIVPRAHQTKAFGRYLPIDRNLMWFLGWFMAEGSLSRHQVSLNLGTKDERFIPDLTRVIKEVFGETPRAYRDPDSQAIKFYFHSVAAARLLRAWGLAGHAHEKRLPEIALGLSEDLQQAFLEGYFLGDGTVNVSGHWSITTNSPAIKDGLLYLLAQLGVVAGFRRTEAFMVSTPLVDTKQPFFTIWVSGKEELERTRAIWQRHSLAGRLEDHLTRLRRKAPAWTPIAGDLIGLQVLKVEEVEARGEFVYDFSVEGDENFVAGTGGIALRNTDADVDGSHIRTLLLTFFFRYMQELIPANHLYIAQPPLYKLTRGKEITYAYTEEQKNRKLAQMTGKPEVARYKGLGEMNPEQLWSTTMNPENRMLMRVEIEDAVEADKIFDVLMGDDVDPRKRFIQTHAKTVRNLDI
jgi:hypothetical protein